MFSLCRSALHSVLHSAHGHLLEENLLLIELVLRSTVIPFTLGLLCAAILRPKAILEYWPIILAPFVSGLVRLTLDDISLETFSSLVTSLEAIGSMAFVSLMAFFGARVHSVLSSTKGVPLH